MVLSLQVSSQGNRWPCQIHPATPTSTVVVERSRSSEHSTVGAPEPAAACNVSCTFRVNSGPIVPSSAVTVPGFPVFVYVDIMQTLCTGPTGRLAHHEAKGRNLKPATYLTGASPV